MNHAIMPKDFMWWLWLVTVMLLAISITGHDAALLAAIALTIGQTIFFWRRHRSPRAIAVQIRLGYTALLIMCLAPPLRWLRWLPTLGTTALLVVGYCLMARCLSLMPLNRREPLSRGLMRRTFLTAPLGRNTRACGGEGGVCELEARVAGRSSFPHQTRLNHESAITHELN